MANKYPWFPNSPQPSLLFHAKLEVLLQNIEDLCALILVQIVQIEASPHANDNSSCGNGERTPSIDTGDWSQVWIAYRNNDAVIVTKRLNHCNKSMEWPSWIADDVTLCAGRRSRMTSYGENAKDVLQVDV